MSAKEKTPKTQTPADAAKRGPKAKAAKPAKIKFDDAAQPRKLSCLDAAAKVLGETGQAMTCPELIATMAAKGYWTSPAGKTPAQTLYAAILREIATKGKDARFTKTERGKFARA